MKQKLYSFILSLFLFSTLQSQTVYKPAGCSASTGPNVSVIVLQHPASRYHLITLLWSSIEPTPGTFNFAALQNMINTVKSYGKKYALAIAGGGTGSPAWLMDELNAPFITYSFQGNSLRLPLFWDNIVQTRIQMMVNALGNQFANDTSLALVYVTQMTANGIEGHLNGIPMNVMYGAGFTPANWIAAAKQTACYYAGSFPDKAIAFEVHEIDTSEVIPQTILFDLYNDTSLCHRVGAGMWWLSGKTTYQPALLNVLQTFPGDKYAQLIGNSGQPWRFKDSLISTAFTQAKQLNIRYIEPWYYEYQYNTIDSLLNDYNGWTDSVFSLYNPCIHSISTGNIVVSEEQSQCFNATGTIHVAGSGTTFLVQAGGSATMIAGQNIVYHPGTSVDMGGYMYGYISTEFCTIPSNPVACNPQIAGNGASELKESRDANCGIIYPNPTSGELTLEQTEYVNDQYLKMEVYTLLGKRILSHNIMDEKKHLFNLGNVANGIYLVRIMCDGKVETIKLVKQ
jgi:hypothetical protein